jgi:P27 family predicted phage terminase small subunit
MEVVMAKGRRPKPTEQKILEGNPGKRRVEPTASIGGKGEICKPFGLSEAASKLWDLQVPMMSEAGLLDRADSVMLGQFFEFWNVCNMCSKIVAGYKDPDVGIVLDQYSDLTGDRNIKANPILSQWRKAADAMRMIGVEYGLTPAARAKLSITKPQDAPMFDDLDSPFKLRAVE